MSTLIDALSFALLTAGAVFCVIGAVGVLRLPDLYTRTHAAAITDTMGAGLILLGLMLQGGFTLVTVKLIFCGLFLAFTSPVAGHALVRAAYSHGLHAKLAPDSKVGQSTLPPPPEADNFAVTRDTD